MTDILIIDKAKDVIRALDALETSLDELDLVDPGAAGRYFMGESLRAAITQARNKRAFYPQLWGDPPRPGRQEQAIMSARLNVETARANLKAMKDKVGVWYKASEAPPKVPQEAIDAATQRLQDAEEQLARLEGRAGEKQSSLKAEAEAKRKAEALAQAAGIRARQERAKALRDAPK